MPPIQSPPDAAPNTPSELDQEVPNAATDIASDECQPLDLTSASPTERTPLFSRRSSVSRATTLDSASEFNSRLGSLRVSGIAFSLWILIFLQASNMSGMITVQGSIASDLGAYEGTMWFTSAYLIAMSSLAPLTGKFAAIFSPRSLTLPIALLIALGSALSALATSFAIFVLGRAIQGAGAAGILTLAIILVLDLTDKRRRGLALSMVNASFSIGVSLGGIIYGALFPVFGWRPMFWIQCPFSILAGIGLFFSLSTPDRLTDKVNTTSVWKKLRQIDYLGACLLVLTIFLFLYGLAGQIQPRYLFLSLASLAIFVAVEILVAADPVIPLKVLSSRAVLLTCASQLALMSARWTALFYMPIFMLAVRGEPRAKAGSILIPTNVGFALGGMVIGWLHIRRNGSFWLPSVVSIIIFSFSMWALSMVAQPDASLVTLVVTVMASGVATGAAVNYTLAHMLHHSHDGTQYITTSLLATFRGFGGAFGTSIGGGIFTRLLQTSLADGFRLLDGGDALSPERKRLVSQLLGAPELVFGSGLNPKDRQVAVDAYSSASRGVWQAAAGLGLIVLVLQAGTGWKGPQKEEKIDEAEAEARAGTFSHETSGEA